MADPITWYAPEKRYKYPHLAPADTSIWERFLEQFPDFLGEVAYDVRVGQGTDPGPSQTPDMREMAIKLSKLRIDVLNHVPAQYYIIELKFDPGVSAVGQLLSYLDHFRRDYPELSPVSCVLICNRLNADIIETLKTYNIQFFIV